MQLPRLVALTPGNLMPRELTRALGAVESALGAGLPGLLLREPRLGDRFWLEFARELRKMCDGLGDPPWFGIHDRAHLAGELRADAIHLGFRSLPAAALRCAGGAPALGVSAHEGDAPELWSDADYLFFSPVLESPSKVAAHPGTRAPIGFGGLERGVREAGRPVLALGGLAPEHVPAVLASGAHGLAVLSGIFGQSSPSAATRAYLDRLPRP